LATSQITAVLAADDNFSRPLAATVRSIVSRLGPGRRLDMYLCDMGITARNRDLIQAAAGHPEVSVRWVSDIHKEVEHLPQVIPHISRAAYARLFIPWVLPRETERVLYLDCDLIARRCIGELFDAPIGDFVAMGVADAASPYVCSPWAVPYWSRYGRRADEVNFNSGVMLMNLTRWREEDVTGAALKYLTDGRHRFLVDQESINAVLPGKIGHVDPRWNQQAEHFMPHFQATLPYGEKQLDELLGDPWIVHFTTSVKAWDYGCTHPFRDEWFANLDQTPYRGWRPSRRAYLAGRGRKLAQRVRKELSPTRAG
jgi:lipopolysaccharide biosynthesis glycosyltransferase